MGADERGKVHRIGPGRQRAKGRAEKSATRYSRSQDHLDHFSQLVRWELEDEMAQVEQRLKEWPKRKLASHGLALFDLHARTDGWMFGDRILRLTAPRGEPMPTHRFGQGDIVTLCRGNPLKESVTEGIMLSRHRRHLRIVVGETPEKLRSGVWRLDRGANRVAHDRMQAALQAIVLEEDATVLSDLLLGALRDPASSAATKADLGGARRRMHPEIDTDALNPSQLAAIEASFEQRLTLVQGPPGTGKTHTAVHMLKAWAQEGLGPILACADSNVAVDNLLEGLLKLGVSAVRLGQPVKVREHLRAATLRALMEEHPQSEEIEYIRQHQNELLRQLDRAKGKEKGLTHRDIRQGWKDIRKIEDEIIEDIIDRSDVICATCIGAGHRLLERKRFPLQLIDEATQATEPTTWVPLVKGARRLVLVGDHHQLPPTVISLRAEEARLDRSLFQRLVDMDIEPHMLTVQYRMHPVIGEFSSARYYDGRIEDGVTAEERPAPAGFLWPDWEHPVAFVPVDGAERDSEDGASKENMDEAAWVVHVVEGLLEAGDLQPRDIGVVTPYNGQVRLLTDLFGQAGGLEDDVQHGKGKFTGLEIRSVDGYQGREKEVIVLSSVRANDTGDVGFLRDWRRLNVALTRARRGLIVIGSPTTLRHDPDWGAWLEWVDERKLEAWHILQS